LKQFLFILSFLFSAAAIAQIPDTITDPDKEKLYSSADNFKLDYTKEEPIQILTGNVKMYQDSIFMFSDYAQIVKSNYLTAIGDVIIIQEDTIRVFSDSLVYDGALFKSELYGNVAMQNGTRELFTNVLYYDLENKVASFPDTMFMQNNASKLNSLEGVYWVDKGEAIFRKKVVVEDSTFILKADSLLFNTKTNVATFISPTYVYKDEKEIYCEAGYYDMNSGDAVFLGNPNYVEGDKRAKANEIKYNKAKNEISLFGSANYKSIDEIATADSIIFNEVTEDVTLLGDGVYIGPDKRVEGDVIVFNTKTESVLVEGEGFLSEPPMIIRGDDIRYDSLSGYAYVKGDVTWKDTSKNNTIYGDYLIYNRNDETVKVERANGVRPLLLQVLDGDTLYLSADTLLYTSIETDSSAYKEFTAFPDVRIFKENMSALSDHLYFDDIDSVFVLTGVPIMWADTSQFSGDTIHINLVNEKVNSLELMQNSFIVNAEVGEHYNQISGTEVLAEFVDDSVDNMYVTGNSRSIYYLKDEEGAFIGLNKTDCSRMRFYFEQDSLTDVRFYTDPTSVLTPMRKATDAEKYLDGFAWNFEIKPNDVDDLLSISKNVSRKTKGGNSAAGIPDNVPTGAQGDASGIPSNVPTSSQKGSGEAEKNTNDQKGGKAKDSGSEAGRNKGGKAPSEKISKDKETSDSKEGKSNSTKSNKKNN